MVFFYDTLIQSLVMNSSCLSIIHGNPGPFILSPVTSISANSEFKASNFDNISSYMYGCGPFITTSIANYLDSTHPEGTTVVGSLGDPLGYGYGLCDMAGNVYELTSSYYNSPSNITRSIPGGCWSFSEFGSVLNSRTYAHPFSTYHHIGFRVWR